MTINVAEIKRYNAELKAQTDKAAKLKAEIDFNTNELNRVCAELTAELGVEVSIHNLEEIYNDRVAKTLNTLESGKEILRRIADGEANINNTATVEVASEATFVNTNDESIFGVAPQAPTDAGFNFTGI